jgi:hypothetical protein
MGEVISSSGPREIAVAVRGSDAIDRIELLRNGRVIATHCHQGTWEPPAEGERSRFKLRVECGWGPRANEFEMERRIWDGELSVEGSSLVGWEPCWLSPGSERARVSGGKASFRLVSSQGNVGERTQTADVFEIEVDPSAQVTLRLNGLERRWRLGELAAASRLVVFEDECREMLRGLVGLDPAAPARRDTHNWHAYKCKLHRAIPEAGFTASLELVDDEPIENGEIHYRVRVEQRNGQRAWSSPVWVRQR